MRDTKKLLEELRLCENFRTFYDTYQDTMVTDTLAQTLEHLLNIKKLKKSQVIKKANITEVYGYQIFSGIRQPERKKVLCLAVGMDLNIEETQTLLQRTGYPTLYIKKPFDCVVMYGICKKMSVVEINELLFRYGLETMG